jgi:hypothetical protein
MKTPSNWIIATAAAVLFSIFGIPERACPQQPCGLSAFRGDPFTLYFTESAQWTQKAINQITTQAPGSVLTAYRLRGRAQ